MKRIGKATVAALVGGAMLLGVLLVGGAVFAQDGETDDEARRPGWFPGAPGMLWMGPGGRVGERPDHLRGAVHADVFVSYEDGTTRELAVDRGRIESADGDSVTLLRPDGETVTLTVDEGTRIFLRCECASIEDVEPGMAAFAVSEAGRALSIRVFDQPMDRDAPAGETSA